MELRAEAVASESTAEAGIGGDDFIGFGELGSLWCSCRGSGVMTTAREIAADLGAAWLFWAKHGQEGSIDGGAG